MDPAILRVVRGDLFVEEKAGVGTVGGGIGACGEEGDTGVVTWVWST